MPLAVTLQRVHSPYEPPVRSKRNGRKCVRLRTSCDLQKHYGMAKIPSKIEVTPSVCWRNLTGLETLHFKPAASRPSAAASLAELR